MMSALSGSWTGLAEALTRSFLMWQGGAFTKLSRISRRAQREKSGNEGRSRGGPLLPGDFGLYSRTSTIYEGPSLMADLIDRVNVSSWLACVTRDWRYLRILSSNIIRVFAIYQILLGWKA